MKKHTFRRTFSLFLFCIVLQGVLVSVTFAQPSSVYLEWTEDPLRSIVVNWITENGTGTPQLQYRVRNSSQAWSTRSGESILIPHSSKQRNSVLIKGLSPGTSYEFRIDGKTDYFRTPPSSITNTFKFIVGGDVYNTGFEDTFAQTSIQAAKQAPYFVVMGGDLAYADADPAKVNRWFNMMEAWYELMVTPGGYLIPFVAAIGNHEVKGEFGKEPEDAIFFHAFFSFPQEQWPGEKKAYGVLDFGSYLSIIVLDTDHTHRVSGTQTNWLENVLKNRKNVNHVFPVYHVGAWPSARSHNAALPKEIRDRWVPLFETHGVRFAFEHHDHAYKRTRPIMNASANGGDVDERGVTYIGDGAWGVRLRDVNNLWYLDKAFSKHHFNLIEISDKFRRSSAIDLSGNIFDQFEEKSFLPPPELLQVTDIMQDGFRMRWEAVSGAKRYRLDISNSSNFSNFIPEFNNRNVGNQTEYIVQNLEANQTYYFRLRAEIPRVGSGTVFSNYSETGSEKTSGVDPGLSTITASPGKVQANSVQSSTITVTIRDDQGNVLPGFAISLVAKIGTLQVDKNSLTTNNQGKAQFKVTNSKAETVTYGAITEGEELSQTTKVTFIPIDPDESSIELSDPKVLANGSANATITVTALDEDQQPFSNINIDLIASPGSSVINAVQTTTGSDGKAVFSVTNHTPQMVQYSAKGTGVTINQKVTVHFVTVDPAKSIVTANQQTVQANGEEESIITVVTKDPDGDTLSGAVVKLLQNGGNSSIDNDQKVSNTDGEVRFRVSGNTPETVIYRVVAENVELAQQVEVQFIPAAPVALSAKDVETRRFTSNWEAVPGASYYLLDVSEDSSFASFVNEYQNFNAGNQTSHLVDGVQPGTTYFYRVRASASRLTGANSKIIGTTTYPDVPVALDAGNRNALYFSANWQPAAGARFYRLDVAEDPLFDQFANDFENMDAGEVLTYLVSGLNHGTTYYYRLRSEAGPRTSGHSNVIETSTFTISSEDSEINSSQLRILANGEQANEITIIVRSDDGRPLQGLEVSLIPGQGHSHINSIQDITDEEGVAKFNVTNTTAEKITYSAAVSAIPIGEIQIEFLPDDGVLSLGNNFPNPFNNQSVIPIIVPRPMNIRLTVYNSLGVPVRTLKNEEIETGYFEIPFNAADLAAGVYFYRLVTEDEIKTGKMVLVK